MFRRSFATSVPRALKITSVGPSSSTVSSLKVLIKGTGSKDAPAGLSHLLASSAFLNTASKSGLRLKREAELLGGTYGADVTRDAVVLKATFLKENLPFFVDAIGSVLAESVYKPHEFVELALPFATTQAAEADADASFKALEELHAVSFRRGLGQPLYYDGTKSFSASDVTTFAEGLISSENIEIVTDNVEQSDLTGFLEKSAFSQLPQKASSSSAAIGSSQKTFTGAESRIRQAGKTVAVVGVPVANADAATYELVAAAVEAAVPSAKTDVVSYDAASLFYASVESEDAAEVAEAVKAVVEAVKGASGSSLAKYKPLAEYLAAEDGLKLGSTKSSVQVPKVNLVVVGDVDSVPLLSELY